LAAGVAAMMRHLVLPLVQPDRFGLVVIDKRDNTALRS
jgi:hypothetical protein